MNLPEVLEVRVSGEYAVGETVLGTADVVTPDGQVLFHVNGLGGLVPDLESARYVAELLMLLWNNLMAQEKAAGDPEPAEPAAESEPSFHEINGERPNRPAEPAQPPMDVPVEATEPGAPGPAGEAGQVEDPQVVEWQREQDELNRKADEAGEAPEKPTILSLSHVDPNNDSDGCTS